MSTNTAGIISDLNHASKVVAGLNKRLLSSIAAGYRLTAEDLRIVSQALVVAGESIDSALAAVNVNNTDSK